MDRSPKWPHSWSRRYIFQSPIFFWHGSSIFLALVYCGKRWFCSRKWSIWRCFFRDSRMWMLKCPSLVNWAVSLDRLFGLLFTPILEWSFVSLVFQTVVGFVCWNWGFSQGLILRKWHWANWMMKKSMCETPREPESLQTQFSWRLCV